MKKVATIVGARPQFIKAGTVARAFAGHNLSCTSNGKITHTIIHTGQHYDSRMSQIFFDELEIARPDYNLEVGSDSHGIQTGKMLSSIEGILQSEKPDLVIIYGDTNSTLAGALATAKLHIPLAHVEAGLRSYNRRMPEEINRVVADEISNLLFCPTTTAVQNLRLEGIPSGRPTRGGPRDITAQYVYQVGDVMYDSILFYSHLAESKSRALRDFQLDAKKYCLATLHRAENTDDTGKLKSILEALVSIAASGTRVILPLHPRTKSTINRNPHLSDLLGESGANINICEPVGYLDMVMLESNSKSILTDSGGVQKEAYLLRVPCITLREETEWVETVAQGWNAVAGTSSYKILEAFACLTAWDHAGPPFAGSLVGITQAADVYGNGHAAENIVATISEYLD